MLTIQIASDVDYDNVVCEINDDSSFLCLLSREEGDDQVMLEFPMEIPIKGKQSMKRLPLTDFLSTLERAREHFVNPESK